MDPIGATASLITLIDLGVKIFKVIHGLLQTYQHAAAELLNLKYKVDGLNSQLVLLLQVQQALAGDFACQSLVEREHLREYLDTTSQLMTDICGNLEDLVSKPRKSAKISWALRDASKVKAWQSQLEKLSSSLANILLLLSLRYSNLLKTDLQELKGLLKASASDPTPGTQSCYHFLWGLQTIGSGWLLPSIACLKGSISAWEIDGVSIYKASLRLHALFCLKALCLEFTFQNLWTSTSLLGARVALKNVVPNDSEIMLACGAGNAPAVWNMLAGGRASVNDITPDNFSPLSVSITTPATALVYNTLMWRRQSPYRVKFILTASIRSPLDRALSCRKMPVARLLMDRGAEFGHINSKGWTPAFSLFGTPSPGFLPRDSCGQYLEILAAASFTDFHAQDREGWSIMHRAAAFDTADQISVLLKRYTGLVDVQTYKLCWTPVFCAVQFGNTSTFHELWRHQRDSIAVVDGRRWTLLHVAANAGRLDIMKFLILEGADTQARTEATEFCVPSDLKGLSITPLQIAKLRGETVLSAFLDAMKAADVEVVKDEKGDIEEIFWPASEKLIVDVE
ncbi:uncharacterized protein PAC_19110 [Phialocephala subalpina]|uniref:Uncharacterized protein n=1 Tax=Phialocephala subalpina TaxID=576137 RepID=A0A1L7XW32_9HELO|nr:uncharacterized protein PAC_19110 [Phialocephala subalpina]